MGAFGSRQNAAVEEAEQSSNHAYKYPPRSGNFFGSHFIMGGERFDTPQPEAYLFGENADLNFLGNRPTAFPYPPPQANEPTKTLKSLVNIRKESVRFIRLPEKQDDVDGNVVCLDGGGDADVPQPDRTTNNSYNIEFTFDSDAKCAITIYYFCVEEVSPSGVTLVPRDGLTSETYHYDKGMNQNFMQPTHIFNPQLIPEDDLIYNPAKEQYPVAIHCVIEEGNEECRQSHTTICVIDHHADCTYALRALKQKIFVDGLCYLLQEIYGIENKAVNKSAMDEDIDDHGSECVICMSETRDTLILPCRHLCLCNSCADSLRYQANNCPICRAPFRALLQIRAVQKGISSNLLHQSSVNEPVCDPHIPAGYIPVSLIEALNGPPQYVARPRDASDSVNTGGDGGTIHKTTSPHKVNNQRRSKNKKHTAAVVSNNTATPTPTPTSNESNATTNKGGINQTVSVVEISTENGTDGTLTKSHSVEKVNSRHLQDTVEIVNERSSLKLPKAKRNGGCNISMSNASALHEVTADDDSENEKLSPLLAPANKCNTLPTKLTKTAFTVDGVEETIDDSGDETQNLKSYEPVKPANKHVALVKANKVVKGSLAAEANTQLTQIAAEDSDYYTPDDTQNSILSPLCPEKVRAVEKLGSQPARGNSATFKNANNLAMKNLHKKSTSAGNIVGPSGGNAGDAKGNISSLPDMLDGPMGSAVANSVSTRSSSDSYSSSSSTKQLLSSNPTTAVVNIIVDDKAALQNAVNV